LSPTIFHTSPQVLYKGSETQVYMDLKNVPKYLSDNTKLKLTENGELPLVSAKLGDSYLDLKEFVDYNTAMPSNTIVPIIAKIQNEMPTSSYISAKFDVGKASNQAVLSETCDADNANCYKTKVLPTISSVSATQSSITGGNTLTIKGEGFSAGAAVVKLSTVACNEIAKTDTEISCMIGIASSADKGSLFATQNGLKKKLYLSTTPDTPPALSDLASLTPVNTTLWTNSEMPSNIG